MKKFVCTVCGYVHEGDTTPAECPICHVGADKFKEVEGEMQMADEHKLRCSGVDAEIVQAPG